MSRINTDHIQTLKDAIADAVLDAGDKLGFTKPGFDQVIAIETSLIALGVTFLAGCAVLEVNPLTAMLNLSAAFRLEEGGDDE